MIDSFVGLDVRALVVGLMAASFATFWLDNIDDVTKSASAILLSAMLAAYGAPVLTVYAIGKFPVLIGAGDALRFLCAVVIGASVTWALPILIDFAKAKFGGKHE